MLFDPIRVYQVLGKDTLLRLRNTEYDENRPMGNVAMMQLDPVVELWLVGLSDETHDILIKLHSWIEEAINRKEDFGDSYNFHHMNLHRAAAMCCWLRSGVENADHWNQARLLNEKISLHDNDYDQKGFSTIRLDEYMAYASLGGHYEAGIIEYQKYHKLKSIRSGILKPRDFGYASCLLQYRSEFDERELFKAGRRMLEKYMQERWLGTGQFVQAIMWLKMVYKYSDEASLSPLQTVLKAYENMPDVPKPLFLVNYST